MAGRGGFAGSVLGRVVDLLLPPACHGCQLPLLPGTGRVCQRCRTRLRSPAHPRCPRCHAPRGSGLPADRPCPECVDWPASLVAARSAVVLAAPADRLVHQLKYGGWPELAPFMAERMAACLGPGELAGVGELVPVPTSPSRLRERGYNQATLLARELSERIGLPLAPALLRRDGGGTQVSLQRHERLDNVRKAFHPVGEGGPGPMGCRTLLVDDVLTTGATASAASEVLAKMGVEEVVLVTFARSLPGEEAMDPPRA